MSEDGPITLHDRTVWFKNGSIHRTDGPAIECKDGRNRWCLNGNEVTEKEVIAYRQIIEQEARELSDRLLEQRRDDMTLDHDITVGHALKPSNPVDKDNYGG
jgi:hypothetical protein